MVVLLVVLLVLLIGFIAYTVLSPKSNASSTAASPQTRSKPSAPAASASDDEEATRVRVAGPRLVRTMGGLKVGDEMQISGFVTIGRGQEATFRFNDAELSGVHAEFRLDAGLPIVTDLGSTNGTFVNGERIGAHSSVPLKEGDQIKLGSTVLIYKLAQ